MAFGMTTTEVRDQLSTRFPRHTIAVSEAAWRHAHGPLHSEYMEYVIAIQPGFDKTENQNFGGNTLEECLAKFNKAAPRCLSKILSAPGLLAPHINRPEIL